jgi:hypothetical protein
VKTRIAAAPFEQDTPMAHATPMFLFLHTNLLATSHDADRAPFLAMADAHGGNALYIDQDGLVDGADLLDDDEDADEAFAAVLDHIGHRDETEFHLHLAPDRLAGGVSGTLHTVLSSFAPEGVDRDELDASMPSAYDVFLDNGVVRTRDAAIWVTGIDYACGSPIAVGDHLEGKRVARPDAALLRASLEAAQVTLPTGVSLEDALDWILVGLLPETHSSHALMAQRARVLEDVRFFATLWEEMDQPARPVVPVFL